ncbi:MAG TPA: GNAT family N-acetyltransferase [Iamia sp.]
MTPALFHVSHEGPFTVLDPRPSPSGTPHEGRPLVWAVDEAHLPQYLLPRDCPRVCWPDGARRVVAIEEGWVERLDEQPLLVHRLAPDGFRVLDPIAGYWVSEAATPVVDVAVVDDCRAAIAARGAELRVVDDLWPHVDRVVAGDGDFSCIRLREARPRRALVPPPAELRTERLVLRRWHEADREPFAALNADPDVMRNFPAPLTREQSDDFVDRIEACFDERGFGLWAVDAGDRGFVGFVGLWWAAFASPATPALEVGWRLASSTWGRGYAPEAARAAVADGLARLDVPEIVSFTWEGNTASRRVMEKIGLTHDPAADFLHPNLPDGHRLRPHVLYRLPRPEAQGR